MKAAALGLMICLLGMALASGPDTLWVRELSLNGQAYGGGVASRGNAIATVGYLISPTDSQDVVVARLDQDGDTIWTRVYDAGGYAQGNSVCLDRESNTLVAGYSFGIGPKRRQGKSRLPLARPARNGFSPDQMGDFAITAKYDSMGGLKWARIDSGYQGIGIAADSSGNSYVSGQYVTSDTTSDMWLAKLNPSGDTVWSRTFNFAPYEFAFRVALDASGNIVTCDALEDSTVHCLTVKIAPDGHIIWTQRFDRDPNDAGMGVAIGPHGSIVVAGMMAPDFTTNHALVLKYDSSGTLLWSKVFAFNLDDELGGASCDPAGDIYVAGHTGANGEYQSLAMKLDSMGNTLWTATYGDSNADAYDVALDTVGDPIIAGDIIDTTTGGSDLLAIKYSALTGIAESRLTGASRVAVHTTITAAPDFVLSVPSTGHYDVRLCDLTGRTRQQVFSGTLSKGAHRLSVSAVPAGMYFVRVAAPDGGVSCQRLVLVR